MSENVAQAQVFEIVDPVAVIAYKCRVRQMDSMEHSLDNERAVCFCRHDPMADNANYHLWDGRTDRFVDLWFS